MATVQSPMGPGPSVIIASDDSNLPGRRVVEARVKKVTSLVACCDSIARARDCDPSKTLVAFDLDLTLKVVNQKKPDGANVEVRGGEETVRVLERLRAQGVKIVLLTATKPSRVNFETIVQSELAVNLPEIAGFFSEDIDSIVDELRVDSDRGSRICYGNSVILAGYDKPAALSFFIKRKGLTPEHILFVDDFVANAVALPQAFVHDFAPLHRSLRLIHGFWFDPSPLVAAGTIAPNDSIENSASYSEHVAHAEKETMWTQRHDLEASMHKTMTHITTSLTTLINRMASYEKASQDALQDEEDRLIARKLKYEGEVVAVSQLVQDQLSRHTLKMGDREVVTCLRTMLKAPEGSILHHAAREAQESHGQNGVTEIDIDPDCIHDILSYLRDGVVYVADSTRKTALQQAAGALGIYPLVQMLSAPVPPPPPPPIPQGATAASADAGADTLLARESMLRAIRGINVDNDS